MRRALSVLSLVVSLTGCPEAPPPPTNPLAVRTLPHPDGGWVVRWMGGARAQVEGEPAGEAGHLRLRAPGPHAVRVGDVEFRVTPSPTDPCAPLRFVALGDGRASVDGLGPSVYWRPMLDEVLDLGPAFVVNTGDLVKDGDAPGEWRNYLRSLPPWPPMLAVRGNHDKGPWFDVHGVGHGPAWGWRVGPVFLAMIDAEVPEAFVPDLHRRLDDLLTASDAPFEIVVMHRPVWSRGNHGSDERGHNARLVPILDRHNVALVLSGHDHDYERFCPSVGVGDARRCVDAAEGTTYVVTGGAATFTVPVPGMARDVDPAVAEADDAASRVFSPAHHYVEIEVRGGVLRGRAARTRAGNVLPPGPFDTFEITRETPCPPS